MGKPDVVDVSPRKPSAKKKSMKVTESKPKEGKE